MKNGCVSIGIFAINITTILFILTAAAIFEKAGGQTSLGVAAETSAAGHSVLLWVIRKSCG
jgi:hypothetical protein